MQKDLKTRNVKHFAQARNTRYHKGAEVLMSSGVVDILHKWEEGGGLRLTGTDLGGIGTHTKGKTFVWHIVEQLETEVIVLETNR